MRLTKKLMKQLHEELWLGWLAEDPKREKEDWPRFKHNGGDLNIENPFCFPCVYSEQHLMREDLGWESCCYCPLDFSGWENTTGSTGTCLGGLFDKWEKARGERRTALARQIGLLPIKKRRHYHAHD